MVFPVILGTLASAGASISSAVGSIGTALSSFAATIAPTLGPLLATLKIYVERLVMFANVFLQLLDILKPGESIEDFGNRALQAAEKGIKIDDYENFDAYMAAQRNFQPDPEISAKYDTVAKLIAGLGICTIGVENKFNAKRGSLNTLWLLPLVNPGYFTPERMQGWLAAGKLGVDILAYLDKRLSDGEARSFENSLESGADGRRMSGDDLDQLYAALDDAREQWSYISQKMKDKDGSQGG